MTRRNKLDETLRAWTRVPQSIEKAISGLNDRDLNLRGGSNGWSIRETVHHLVEANLIASNIIVAGLAKSGCTYDWSWVNPDRSWMKRVGYSRAPVRPALETLRTVCRYLAGLVSATGGAPARKVKLLDAPGAKPRAVTVGRMIRDEVEHARHHLRDVAATRKQHAR